MIRRFEFVFDSDGHVAREPLTCYVNVCLRDGKPWKIQCAANDTGSLESGLLRGFFDSINAHLERGVKISELAPLFTGTKFEPVGQVRIDGRNVLATSPLDAIFRWLGSLKEVTNGRHQG